MAVAGTTSPVRGAARAATPRSAVERADTWPRTGRVLPWSLAAFLALLWLTPFHAITLGASLPFDLTLDRLVLPVVLGLWALTLAAGGPDAPHLRWTPLHLALGLLVAVAYLSVAVNAGGLSHALLLDDALKRLLLLSSYAALFVVLASTVRPAEVQAFLTFTLILAMVAALGVVYEYRFEVNVFYDWAGRALPNAFRVPVLDESFVDENGRRAVVGPAEVGLETVAMLAMALPVAVVGLLHGRAGGRRRWLYAMAVCLLFAAALCTYRKSALIAPIAALATLAWFRPRGMLRLAPLAAVLAVVVHLLAPGAIGNVTDQLHGSRLDVNTTHHRVEAYDAVRPLVWSNVALGQGYGSYDAYANRILDSQVLTAAIETGVLGLAAYVALLLGVVGAARRGAGSGERWRATPALTAAAAAVVLLTVSFLYDAMIFPHVPYIFMTFAGLLAVVWRDHDDEAAR